MSKGFEGFECMYGQASAEWENPNNNNGSPPTLQPFLFHVHAIDASHIRIHVTDFHSNTFEAVRSLPQLEDLRDDIGVGGSWSEFVDYLIASMKSVDVKLLLGSPIASSKLAGDNDTQFAKLIAQKSKGMPLISINLDKLTNIPANDAMSDLSLELFKAFTSKRDLVVKEQERCYHLTRSLSAEEEKSRTLQHQLDAALFSKRQKVQKSSAPIMINLDSDSVTDAIDSAGKPSTQEPLSTKAGNRVVPAYRRAKVRGAILEDSGDDEGIM